MTNGLLYFYVAVCGALVGSFLNVLILRDDRRGTIITGRSECATCKKQLRWYELIPVVSFLIQGGRCRKCKTTLSWQYPAVELLTAAAFVFAFWYGQGVQGNWTAAIALCIVFSLYIVISAIDIRTLYIPVEYAVLAGIIGGVGMYLSELLTWQDILLGIIAGGGSIAIVMYGWKFFFKQDGMGDGDIWLAASLGAVAGYPLIFPVLIGAVSTGALLGLLAMATKKTSFQAAIPFGPFLCFGLLIALVWGQSILQWYIL
jgi:leader peptidase (prepilin peptidase)/N-methyltransferase